MRRVIVESPYAGRGTDVAGEIRLNVEYARECIKDCLKRGEAPIASHLLFTQPGILDDDVPEERRLGVEAGLAWITAATAMVVYIDRGVSEGMRNAIQRATGVIPVERRSLYGRPVVERSYAKRLEDYPDWMKAAGDVAKEPK